MATSSEVSLTRDQRCELNRIAHSRSLSAGYVFRAKHHPDAGRRSFLQHHRPQVANQCAYHRALEATFPRIWAGWTGYLSSRPEGHGSDSGFAGSDSVGYRQKAQRRFHPLQLPRTGDDAGPQQRCRASRMERGRPQTPPLGAFSGQRRSGVREQRGRHSRLVPESAAARGTAIISPRLQEPPALRIWLVFAFVHPPFAIDFDFHAPSHSPDVRNDCGPVCSNTPSENPHPYAARNAT